jgi:hypothetical protein
VSEDVGAPAFPGSAEPSGEGGECIAVWAGDAGITGTSDQFHFVYQETAGNPILTARISEIAAESPGGTVGIMFRESLDPAARHAAVLVDTSGARRFRFRYRDEAGERSRTISGDLVEFPDAWVQIRRVGSELVGLGSPDGETWTEVGHATVDLPEVFLAGIAAAGKDQSPDQPYLATAATVCDLQLGLRPVRFRRGDANDDGTVDLSDAVATLGVIFLGAGEITCEDAGDANDDGLVDVSDAVFTLGVLFLGAGPIPLPAAYECGVDPTGDDLGCEVYAGCP